MEVYIAGLGGRVPGWIAWVRCHVRASGGARDSQCGGRVLIPEVMALWFRTRRFPTYWHSSSDCRKLYVYKLPYNKKAYLKIQGN